MLLPCIWKNIKVVSFFLFKTSDVSIFWPAYRWQYLPESLSEWPQALYDPTFNSITRSFSYKPWAPNLWAKITVFQQCWFRAAAIAQWFHQLLSSCGRGFESEAHQLCFFQFLLLKLWWAKDENKQKGAGIDPFKNAGLNHWN